MYGIEHELSTACANVKPRSHSESNPSAQPASLESALLGTEIQTLEHLRDEYQRVEELGLEVQIDVSGFTDAADLHEIRRYETSHRNQLRKEIDGYWRRRADRAEPRAWSPSDDHKSGLVRNEPISCPTHRQRQ